jgi:hypothetical protein
MELSRKLDTVAHGVKRGYRWPMRAVISYCVV